MSITQYLFYNYRSCHEAAIKINIKQCRAYDLISFQALRESGFRVFFFHCRCRWYWTEVHFVDFHAVKMPALSKTCPECNVNVNVRKSVCDCGHCFVLWNRSLWMPLNYDWYHWQCLSWKWLHYPLANSVAYMATRLLVLSLHLQLLLSSVTLGSYSIGSQWSVLSSWVCSCGVLLGTKSRLGCLTRPWNISLTFACASSTQYSVTYTSAYRGLLAFSQHSQASQDTNSCTCNGLCTSIYVSIWKLLGLSL